ncbi:MAG: xanthine dehydrogenase family protein molybdopterin-binding subunit [Thermodesulfobacteriota bacterium]
MQDYSVIGKRLPRLDGMEIVTGKAKYTDDIVLPGTLAGKILTSEYPHARILHIDTSKAEKLSGVRGIITGKNVPMVQYGFANFVRDEYPLAFDKVRYIGDEIAAVAAIDEDIAEEALDLIEVEYEELPSVFDPEEAMKPGAPRIHEHAERNICSNHVSHVIGDVDKGFRESDYVREDRFVTQNVSHCFLETRNCLADFNANGELTFWTSTSSIYLDRFVLSHLLKIPVSKIKGNRPFVGGGFGGKGETVSCQICAALLSMKTGKPVKITLSREEQFIADRGRHRWIFELRTGAKKDGTIIAKQCRAIADAGAYNSLSFLILMHSVGYFDIVYRVPNVRYDGDMVYTNNPPCGAMRSFDCVQLRLADDSHMDMLARDLGIDTIDLYLKNVSGPGDLTASRYKLDSNGLRECIERVRDDSGWRDKRGRLPVGRGIGFAVGASIAGAKSSNDDPDASSALVKINEDGSVNLLIAAHDAGQGSRTVFSQTVAEELGIAIDDVKVNFVIDTDIIPQDQGSYASRTTIGLGNAVLAACRDAKRQIFEVVADQLHASAEDLEAKDGVIYLKGSPDGRVSFKDEGGALSLCLTSKKVVFPIIGRGHFEPETEPFDWKTGEGNISIAYGFTAKVAEVEVDTETGRVKVLNVTSASDVGKALNPLFLEGQDEGAIAMGIGQALFEKLELDKGQILNPSFSEYKIPTALDMPRTIRSTWVETLDPHSPFGAKGIGEAVIVPMPAAIANAVYDAVGVRINEFPITPDKILEEVEKKGKLGE